MSWRERLGRVGAFANWSQHHSDGNPEHNTVTMMATTPNSLANDRAVRTNRAWSSITDSRILPIFPGFLPSIARALAVRHISPSSSRAVCRVLRWLFACSRWCHALRLPRVPFHDAESDGCWLFHFPFTSNRSRPNRILSIIDTVGYSHPIERYEKNSRKTVIHSDNRTASGSNDSL